MSEEANLELSHITLVVGIDLSDVSEHLLAKARDLVRSVDDAELHVVHVVQPESLRVRLTEPLQSDGIVTQATTKSAQFELERLCRTIVSGSNARWVIHTPVGRAADELTRVAREVGADLIVVEPHDRSRWERVFHRSVVARIARLAPCSVLTVRERQLATTAAA